MRSILYSMSRKGKSMCTVVVVLLAGAGWLAYDSWMSLVKEHDTTYYQSSLDAFDVLSPHEGDFISSPFLIKGIGNMFWFMDGFLPVRVEKPDGELLWEGKAKPKGDGEIYGGVSFEIEANVDTYRGPAQVRIVPGDTTDAWGSTTSRVVHVIIK